MYTRRLQIIVNNLCSPGIFYSRMTCGCRTRPGAGIAGRRRRLLWRSPWRRARCTWRWWRPRCCDEPRNGRELEHVRKHKVCARLTTMHTSIDLSTTRPPIQVFMIYASLAWIPIIIWKPYRSIIILLTNYRTRWWW